MQFYNSVVDHIKMIIDGLSNDLNGREFVDYAKVYHDNGQSEFSYVIGDIDPMGFNSDGQQAHEVEIELRVMVPTSKTTHDGIEAQMYAVGVSMKICELLKSQYYGLSGQREDVEIESNRAIGISGVAKSSFVGRSIVFRQTVYLGADNVHEISFDFAPPVDTGKPPAGIIQHE